MRYKPRRFQRSIITNRIWVSMTVFGFLMSAAILWRFEYNLQHHDLVYAVSVAFTAMVILEMVRLVDIRSYYKVKWSANPWLVVAIVSSVILQLLVLNVPFLADLFEVDTIKAIDWGIILGSGLALFLIMRVINSAINRLVPEFKENKAATANG